MGDEQSLYPSLPLGSLQVIPQGNDADPFKFTQFEHGFVSGHDKIGSACNCAFENPVVRFVLEDVDSRFRSYHQSQASQSHGDLCQLFPITAELSREHAQNFF